MGGGGGANAAPYTGFRDVTPIMESQVDNRTENEAEPGITCRVQG